MSEQQRDQLERQNKDLRADMREAGKTIDRQQSEIRLLRLQLEQQLSAQPVVTVDPQSTCPKCGYTHDAPEFFEYAANPVVMGDIHGPATTEWGKKMIARVDELDRYQPVVTDEQRIIDPHEAAALNRIADSNYRHWYNELLYQVVQAVPGETRHEAAIRLLRKAQSESDAALQDKEKE